jgi:hypothetical protein
MSKKKNNFNDGNSFVDSLLNGKFDGKGKFVPFRINENRPINEIRENTKDALHDIMYRENLWPSLVDINHEEFRKSELDKKYVKGVKNRHKQLVREAGFNPKTRLNISEPGKLIL